VANAVGLDDFDYRRDVGVLDAMMERIEPDPTG
jgi:hypothetical protein